MQNTTLKKKHLIYLKKAGFKNITVSSRHNLSKREWNELMVSFDLKDKLI